MIYKSGLRFSCWASEVPFLRLRKSPLSPPFPQSLSEMALPAPKKGPSVCTPGCVVVFLRKANERHKQGCFLMRSVGRNLGVMYVHIPLLPV